MNVTAKIVRLQNALHAVRERRDADHLVIGSEQSLVLVDWSSLQHRPESEAVSFGPRAEGRLVASGVATDNAFVVDPKSGQIVLARERRFEVIDPDNAGGAKEIHVEALPRGTFGAAFDPSGQRVLLAIVRVRNPDFASYAVALADLGDGTLSIEKTIASNAELELLWDRSGNVWMIGDCDTGVLWRWDGRGVATRIAGPDERIHSATFTAGSDGVTVSAVCTKPNGETLLVTGLAEQTRIAWKTPIPLAGSSLMMARRHPDRPLWACLTQQGSVQHIKMSDGSGKILAEVAVRPGCYLDHLQWSVFLRNRLWAYGSRALAAVSVTD